MCEKIQGYDPTYIFCTINVGKGTCSGDSGGPIVDRNPIDGLLNLTTVIGATSFGPDIYNSTAVPIQCTDVTRAPSYFADIQAGWSWIYETIKGTKLFSWTVPNIQFNKYRMSQSFDRIEHYQVALLQDPVLGYHVGAPYAARVYDAAPAPRNQVSLQRPLRKVYSISNVYASYQI